MLGGLVGSADGGGLVAGPDGGAQGAVQVVGQPGVPGQLGRGARCPAVGQRGGVLGVQPDPLARQQVVVHGLAEQRVPEGVAAVAGHEHVHLDGLAQRLLEVAGVEAGGDGEQVVRDLAAGDARDPHGLAGVVVEPVEADEEEVGQVLGKGLAHAGGADELLDEEGVALGAVDDRLELEVGEADRRQLGDEHADVVVAERAELEALDAADPGPLGDLAAERVAAVQVVGAVRRDDGDRAVEGPGEEEAEQVAGGLVGPVAVLDHDEQGAELGDGLEQRVHRAEQVGAVDLLAPRRRRRAARPRSRRRSADITRRPGRRRDRAGCSYATLATSSGSSASRRPRTSENGR